MRVKLIPFGAALLAAAMTMVVFAPAASANEGVISMKCNVVTFSYIRFPIGTDTIGSETVVVDGTTVASQSFTFTGPNGADAIPITLTAGSHTITATANWGKPHRPKSATSTQTVAACGGIG